MNIQIFYTLLGYRIEALVKMIKLGQSDESSVVTRFLYIQRGWSYFLRNPWHGYGLDTFRYLAGSYGTYSHNNYIELLVSGGIPTLFFFYFYRFIVLIKLVNFNKDKLLVLLFVLLVLLFILEYGFVSYFERIYIIIYTFIFAGVNQLPKKL
jgi:O-antigen ligase